MGQGTVIPLERGHYNFCRCRAHILEKSESHNLQVWELGIATPQRIHILLLTLQIFLFKTTFVPSLLRVSSLEVAHLINKNLFLFYILKPLSFSWSHLSDLMHSLTPADSPLASQSLASSACFKETAFLPSAREIMSCWMEARFVEASDGLNQSLLSYWRTHQTGGHVIFYLHPQELTSRTKAYMSGNIRNGLHTYKVWFLITNVFQAEPRRCYF